MANNIYIGARYVPMFADPVEWDNLRTYEPLTIVTYQGTSYTSKKAVPVGIALNNTEYWVATGNYNAQVAQYHQDVEEYKSEFDTFKNAQTAINNNVSSDITDINDRIDKLDDRKFIFISDSYGETRDNSTWFNELAAILGLSSNDYYETHQGGYGFTGAFGAGTTFLNLLTNLNSTITNKSEITDIVVVGGFNDRTQSVSNIESAISNFCTYAHTNYPNAKIYIGGFGWSFNSEFKTELDNGKYLTAYKNCYKYGAIYIKGSDYVLRNSAYFYPESSDYTLHLVDLYVHPNAEGSRLIAECVYSNLVGDNFTIRSVATASITLASGISNAGGDLDLVEIQTDDCVIVAKHANVANLRFNTAQTASYTEYIEIGTYSNGMLGGTHSDNKSTAECTVMGFIAGGDVTGNNRNVPLQMMFAYNRLYIRVFDDGIHFTNIWIPNFQLITNTLLC